MVLEKRLISIVVPAFNEDKNIEYFYEAVNQELGKLGDRYTFEFIFTDNCSTDLTFERLKALGSSDDRVRAARFSKNFGYQRSIFTGYMLARGDCAIQMDCDLQDPPALIHDLIAKWEEGFEVVYGVRKTRDEAGLVTIARRIFYRILDFLSEEHIPHDAGDFRLVDRKVLNQLKFFYDTSPYLRGAIASLGFRQVGISYHRPSRQRGKSKFGMINYISLAVDGILNHSIMPLRVATATGFMISTCLVLYFAGLFFAKIFYRAEWPRGFATMSVLILVGISANALFLGVIGEYLGRIYRQVKRPPMTVIDEVVNLPSTEKGAEQLGRVGLEKV